MGEGEEEGSRLCTQTCQHLPALSGTDAQNPLKIRYIFARQRCTLHIAGADSERDRIGMYKCRNETIMKYICLMEWYNNSIFDNVRVMIGL